MLWLARLPDSQQSHSQPRLVNSIFPVGHAGVFERISLIQRKIETSTANSGAHQWRWRWLARPVSDKQYLSLAVAQTAGEIRVISISSSSGEILALLRNSENQQSLCKYSPDSNTWEAVQPMNVPRDLNSLAGAVIGDFFYVAGGFPEKGRGGSWMRRGGCSAAERLDLRTYQWEKIPAMHQGHTFGKGFALDGCFFCVGRLPLGRSAQRFDPVTKQWTLIPDFLSQNFERFSFAVLKSELYMLTWSSAEPCGRVMKYQKTTGQWTFLDRVPDPKSKYCFEKHLCPVGNEVWVVECERYERWGACNGICCETSVWPVFEGPSFWPAELGENSGLAPQKFVYAFRIEGAGEAPLWRTIPIFDL